VNLELPLGAAAGPLSLERPHPVGAVVAAAKEAVEAVFRGLWIEAELSSLKFYERGAMWYGTLRDPDGAELDCIVFRFESRKLQRVLTDIALGTQVFVRGDLSVNTKKSRLQFIVRDILPRPVGGFHQLQFEKTYAALQKDGLLDVARKRALPRFPRRIAVVTSREGAVWHDIVTTVGRRWPFVELVLVASLVQGDEAPAALCRALALAARLADLDVIVVARGGGSKEDLSCFNDEKVARAVAAAPVPVISAVGHETDVTITDLVADARAATPTAAAELAVPDRAAVLRDVAAVEAALGRAAARSVEGAGYRLRQAALRVDRAVARRIDRAAQRAQGAEHRITTALESLLARRGSLLERVAASLDALSPLTVLGRGYSVARDGRGRVLRRTADFAPGEDFRLRVSDGEVQATTRTSP
jgi:exodeoxyribonuclease VII large subunit